MPSYLFRILTFKEPGEALGDLHLEIFDGDLSGSHDTTVPGGAAARTCYQRFADPEMDGSGESGEPLVVKDDTDFSNNAWARCRTTRASLRRVGRSVCARPSSSGSSRLIQPLS